jgi:hypothetical protein
MLGDVVDPILRPENFVDRHVSFYHQPAAPVANCRCRCPLNVLRITCSREAAVWLIRLFGG